MELAEFISRREASVGQISQRCSNKCILTEASIAPGFALITGMFYTRSEQPSRQAAWFVGNSIAVLLGGLIAYGIGNIHITAIAQWQLLFLILGAITSAYGVILFFTLPDSPAKAVFLKPNERAIAVHRTLKNKTGVLDTGKFKWGQVLMAIKDLQTWFLMPIGGAQLVFLLLTSGLISLNVAGFTKKSTVSALMFAAYCIGNIAGPQFFLPSEEPLYLTGIRASMAGLAFGIFFLVCLSIYYVLENRRRDRLYRSPKEMSEIEELQDELSNETDHEIESFRYVL
ncbi:hypothetical protein N7453_011888 [Penicillium expansum]|nr:hypothetical protein N7453_011888 [Penicillium expansum]